MSATDWVDGYIARHFDQVSELGKVLDPTADRILLIVGVGGIMVDGSAPVWLALVVLAREVAVGATVLILAALGARRIEVQWAGKAGTFGLMTAFPLFLGAHSDTAVAGVAGVLAWCAVVPGLALALYAAVAYIPMARTALREGRAG